MEEIRLAGLRRKQTKDNQEINNNQQNAPIVNQQITAPLQNQARPPIVNNVQSNEQIIPPSTTKQIPTLGQFLKNSLFDDEDPMFTSKKSENDRSKKPSIFDDTVMNKKEEKTLPNVLFEDNEKEKEASKKKEKDIKGKLSRLFDENNDFDDEKPLEKSSADITSKLNMILGDNKKSEPKPIKQEIKLDNDPLSSYDMKPKNKQESILSGSNSLGNSNKDEIKRQSIKKPNLPVNSRIKSLLQEEDEENDERPDSFKKPTIIDPLSQSLNKNNPVLPNKINLTDPLSKPTLTSILLLTKESEEPKEENIIKNTVVEEEKSNSKKMSTDMSQLHNVSLI